MWIFIEILFFLNLLIIICPMVSRGGKKRISMFTSAVLTGCLLLCFLLSVPFLLVLPTILISFPFVFQLDGVTTIFAALTTFLIFICLLISVPTMYNYGLYVFVLWLLQFLLLHTFTSLHLLSFYVFFEITLIPMMLLILLWGSRQRKLHAMYMFFFYTVVGSIFLLLGILFTYFWTFTLLLPSLQYIELSHTQTLPVWLFFFIGFAFKVPLVPVHTWLPEAHVEAPTTGSIILAGLLLKVGTFGMLRFMFPFLNNANSDLRPAVYAVALFSVYYASFIAIRQQDLKKIIAYSSVAHMGFVVAGLFSMTYFGLLGSIFTMLSHGIVASALFYLVGVVYERYKTRNVLYYGGLINFMPLFGIVFFLFMLANIGFPFTSNFVGEFLVLGGVLSTNLLIGILLVFSIVLAPIYSIWVYNRVFYGSVSTYIRGFSDLNIMEFIGIVLLLAPMVCLGVKPGLILEFLEPKILQLLI